MVLIDKRRFDYQLALGSPLPAFSLPGTDGKQHASTELKPIAVIVFWCNHCPYVKAAERKFVEIATKFASVASFIAINSNDPTDYPEDDLAHMRAKRYPFPYLVDASQDVARAFGAECTPHAFIFKDGKLAYQGRIDDAGQRTENATTSELLEALIALSQGRQPAHPLSSALGCSIKWRQ